MSDVRSLLIDVRMAMRAAARAQDARVLERIDRAIAELGASGAGRTSGTTAQQVALAWQAAAREIRMSHPDVHAALSNRVMAMLDVRTLVEPDEELRQLEKKVAELQRERETVEQRVEEVRQRRRDVQAQLDTVLSALAAQAPAVHGHSDPVQLALQRIDALASQSRATTATMKRPDMASPIPNRPTLEVVAAGREAFTDPQREWVVGEALGLTGWQYTPVELLGKGDVWLAQLILDKGNVK